MIALSRTMLPYPSPKTLQGVRSSIESLLLSAYFGLREVRLTNLLQDSVTVSLGSDNDPQRSDIVDLVQTLLFVLHFPHDAIQVLWATTEVHALQTMPLEGS